MPQNQALLYAELLAGGVLAAAAITGGSIPDVIAGRAKGKRSLVTDLPQEAGSSSQGGPGDAFGFQVGPGGYVLPTPSAGGGRTDNGVDFETRPGTALRALGSGYITTTSGGFPGSLVLWLDHPINGIRGVYYGHLQGRDMLVRQGQRVTAGQVIARTSQDPPGASGMPGHTEIGLTRNQQASGFSHVDAATGLGSMFRHFLDGLGLRG